MDFGMFGWWVVVGVLAGWLTGFVMKDVVTRRIDCLEAQAWETFNDRWPSA